MAELASIEFENVSDIDSVFSATSHASTTISSAGQTAPNRPLRMAEFANAEVQNWHYSTLNADALQFCVVRDATVSGQSVLLHGNKPLNLPSYQPFYVHHYLETETIEPSSYATANRQRKHVDSAYLITHFNSATYGHWLLEGLPKLLWIYSEKQRFSRLEHPSFIVNHYLTEPVVAWIKYLFPHSDIIVFDQWSEYLHVDKLFIPSLFYSGEYFLHSMLDDLVETVRKDKTTTIDDARPLYLTRTKPSAFRHFANHAEIEAIAAKLGFALIAPETLTIEQQLSLFCNQNAIAGEYGSALHNSLFMKSGADIVSFNCVNSCQSRIAQLRQQNMTYVLGTSGKTTKFRLDGSSDEFAIDAERAEKALRTLL